MALHEIADGRFGQFQSIVAGTWAGMPPNIKGFIPRLLKITAALRLLKQHYTTCADWEEDGDSPFLKEAYSDAKQDRPGPPALTPPCAFTGRQPELHLV